MGYLIQLSFQSSTYQGYIYKATSFSGVGYTDISTKYGATLSAALTGWVNFAIYISSSGYMSVWINGNLVADATDLTTPPASLNGNVYYAYIGSPGKIAPVQWPRARAAPALTHKGPLSLFSRSTCRPTQPQHLASRYRGPHRPCSYRMAAP